MATSHTENDRDIKEDWVESEPWFRKIKRGISGTKASITAKKCEAIFSLRLAGVLHPFCDSSPQRGWNQVRHSAVSSDNHNGFSNVNIEEILKPAWGGIWEKRKEKHNPYCIWI